jgi:hypothetical protein
VLDGFDLTPVLKGSDISPRNELIYYHNTTIFAARKGDYKLYFYSNNPLGYPPKVEKLETYKLFNLSVDPSEQYDLLEQHPEVVTGIVEMVEKHKAGVVMVKSQLEDRSGQPTLRP